MLEVLFLIPPAPTTNQINHLFQETRRRLITLQLIFHPRQNTFTQPLIHQTIEKLHKRNHILITPTYFSDFFLKIFQTLTFRLTAPKIVIIIHHSKKTSTHRHTETSRRHKTFNIYTFKASICTLRKRPYNFTYIIRPSGMTNQRKSPLLSNSPINSS